MGLRGFEGCWFGVYDVMCDLIVLRFLASILGRFVEGVVKEGVGLEVAEGCWVDLYYGEKTMRLGNCGLMREFSSRNHVGV